MPWPLMSVGIADYGRFRDRFIATSEGLSPRRAHAVAETLMTSSTAAGDPYSHRRRGGSRHR